MTTPMNPDTTQSVGLLGRIFGKVQKAPSPPAGVEDRANFTDTVGSMGTDAAYQWEGAVPNYNNPVAAGYFPTVAQQDALLTHVRHAPADQNPDAWYQDKDRWGQSQLKEFKAEGVPWMDDAHRPVEMEPDPRWIPPGIQRPTAFLSPSSYRFQRPFDQTSEHELNGVHLSLADNRRAYMLGGTVGQSSSWNNSYRVDPTTNDTGAVFVGDTVQNNVDSVVLAQQVNSNTFSRPFRLG